jgi:Tol biopolymer transport system component
MRLRIYLGILLATLGLAAAGSLSVRSGPSSWRAIGAIQPKLSPDGESIAMAYQGAIWRLARNGGVMRRLTSDARWDSDPAWSPDGKRIVYVASGQVAMIDAESGASLALPARVPARGSLQFHPDGSRLLANVGKMGAIALSWVDLNGGAVTPLLDPPAERIFALSPDGNEIAYAVHRDISGEQGGSEGPQADLWIRPAAGGSARKLVRFPSRIYDLAWKGASLIAVSNAFGAHEDLWEIPLASPEQARKLSFGQADEAAPSVAGSWLLYTDNREGATALVVRDLSSGEEKTVVVSGLDFGKPTGELELEFVEKGSGAPLCARVAIQEEKGKPSAPPGALYRLRGDQMDFFAERTARLSLPAGRHHLHAWHGPEYAMAHLEVEVAEGKRTARRVELERWADPASKGWYSGENHIHANYGYGAWYNTPDELKRIMEAEGLNVANLVVANSDTDGVFDREFFRGRPDPVSSPRTILYWNEEFRATLWGHLTLVNLKQLVEPIFTGFADTTNPWDTPTNSDVADHTHLQGGHVNYTHPAANLSDPYFSAYSAKSLPVDVALGKIDSLDINWSYEPTLSLWYRFLNCGFRLPASAGTDCFINRIRSRLPGADRAYVKIDGDFSYDAWMKGLREGRSFVSNGPILDVDPGGTVQGPVLSIRAEARSPLPIDRFEAVVNGLVVATGMVSPDKLSAVLDQKVTVSKSGWYGVRVFAGRLQAHSSPTYVELPGKPAGSKADAEFFLTWIDRLEAQLKKRARVPSPELAKHVVEQLSAARAQYRAIAQRE